MSLSELTKATNKFDKRRIIGSGGFGNVYWGFLEKSGTIIAVKRRKPYSEQGEREFYTEIEMLSNPEMKHSNLVSLIGYCNTDGEMILVYEYIEKGTLKSHLYGSDRPSLSWKERLVVAVGAARGLAHLHAIPPNGIIHRDVKSGNILLDEKLCAKIADFGIAKAGPDLEETHLNTRVMGTTGYIDPAYATLEQLNKKSDVYSYAVVLLEILCGRRVIDGTLSEDQVSLVGWAMKMLDEGKVIEIVDKKLLGTIHPHYLTMFGNIVLRCLAKLPEERPTMQEVLQDLEWELKSVRESGTASTVPAAEDESDHVVPAQPIIMQENGRALTRSEGKVYKRTPGFGELETITERSQCQSHHSCMASLLSQLEPSMISKR